MRLFSHSSTNLIISGLFRNPEFCPGVRGDAYPFAVALCPRNGTAGARAQHSPRSWHRHQEPQHSHNSVHFNPSPCWAPLQTHSLTNTGWFQPSLC